MKQALLALALLAGVTTAHAFEKMPPDGGGFADEWNKDVDQYNRAAKVCAKHISNACAKRDRIAEGLRHPAE